MSGEASWTAWRGRDLTDQNLKAAISRLQAGLLFRQILPLLVPMITERWAVHVLSLPVTWTGIKFVFPLPPPAPIFCYLMFLHLLSPFRGHILLGKWLLWDKSPGAFKSIGSVLKGKCSFLSCVRILPLFELPPRNDSGKLLFLQNGLCLLLQMCFFSSGKLFLMKSFS